MAELQIDLVVNDKGKLVLTGFGNEVDKVMFSSKAAVADFGKTLAIAGSAVTALTLVGGLMVSKYTEITDRYTLLDNKLKLVTDDTEQLTRVNSKLYDISLLTHQGMETSVSLYAGMARSTKELHISEERLLSITESMNKAYLVSGATQEQAATSQTQMNQALRGGIVRAEEYNSIMDATPRVLDAVAEGLGKTSGELFKMMLDGKLTAQTFLEGFEKGAAGIDREFEQIQVTTRQALGDLNTVFESIIDGANDSSGATGKIAQGILDLAETVDANREGITSFFSGVLTISSSTVTMLSNMTQSLQGWAAVADDKLGFFEFAAMNAEELAAWLKQDALGLSDIDKQLDSLANKREEVALSFAFTSEARKAKQAELAEIDKQTAALNLQKDVIVNLSQILENEYVDSWQKAADAASSATGSGTKQTTKGTDTEVDKEQLKKYARQAQDITDLWLAGIEERQEADQRAIDEENTLLEEREAMHESLTDEINRMSLSETDYKKQQLEAQIDNLREMAGEDEELQDEIARYRILKLQEIEDANERTVDIMEEAWTGWAVSVKKDAKDVLGEYLNNEFDDLGDAWNTFCDSMEKKWVNTLAELIVDYADSGLAELFDDDLSGDGEGGTWWDELSDWGSSLFEWDAKGGIAGNSPNVAYYAEGGVAESWSGRTGVDDIYAGYINGRHIMLAGGEYIMPVQQTMLNRGLLDDMRDGKVVGYEDGGSVSLAGASFSNSLSNYSLSDALWGEDFSLMDIVHAVASPSTFAAMFGLRSLGQIIGGWYTSYQEMNEVLSSIDETNKTVEEDLEDFFSELDNADKLDDIDDSLNDFFSELDDMSLSITDSLSTKATSEDIESLSTDITSSISTVSSEISSLTTATNQVSQAVTQAQLQTTTQSTDSGSWGFGYDADNDIGGWRYSYYDNVGRLPIPDGPLDPNRQSTSTSSDRSLNDADGSSSSASGDNSKDDAGKNSSGAGGVGTGEGYGGYAKGGWVNSLLIPEGDDGFGGLSLGELVVPEYEAQQLFKALRNGDFSSNARNITIEMDTAGIKTTNKKLEELRKTVKDMARDNKRTANVLKSWENRSYRVTTA